MEKQFVHTFTWSGENIGVGTDGNFYVFLLEKGYASLPEARVAIDRKLASLEKVAKKKLELPVYDKKGQEYTITGIHAGSGRRLFKPKYENSYNTPEEYPVHPKVLELLNKRKRVVTELAAINEKLHPLKLIGDWYQDKDKATDARYAEVEVDYETKLKKAQELV